MKSCLFLQILLFCTLFHVHAYAERYQPHLSPVTTEVATNLLKRAKSTTLQLFDEDSHQTVTFGIPWPYAFGENCSDRALITYLSMVSDLESPHFVLPLSSHILNQVIQSPKVELARISLIAPMAVKQTIQFSPTRSKEYMLLWKNHEALAINVEGEIKVIDLSASETPIPIKDWVQIYFKETQTLSCPHLDYEDYDEIFYYEICLNNGWIPDPNSELPKCIPPKNTCGYMFREGHGFHEEILDNAWGGLIYDVNSAAFGLLDDVRKMSRDSGIHLLDPIKEAPFFKSSFKPINRTWKRD